MDCRICLESNNQESMISPCRCSGTSQWVHRECIERWIRQCENLEAKKKCMECHHYYEYYFTEDTLLIKYFKVFKKNFYKISALISSILILIAFTIFGIDKPREKIKSILDIYVQIVYIIWILINLYIELTGFYCSYKDKELKLYVKKSFLKRFTFIFFGYVVIFFITYFWHFIFGFILMYFILCFIDNILDLAVGNLSIKI